MGLGVNVNQWLMVSEHFVLVTLEERPTLHVSLKYGQEFIVTTKHGNVFLQVIAFWSGMPQDIHSSSTQHQWPLYWHHMPIQVAA